MNRCLRPRFIVVRFQSNIKLAIEKAGGVRAVVGAPEFRTRYRNHRILDQEIAYLRRKFRRFFKGNCVRHGGANPHRAFIQMWKELSTNEWDKQEGASENQQRHKDRDGPG